MDVFEGKKSSNDIINNGTMSDDEVVASDVPPRYLLDTSSHIYQMVCPSICPSVRMFVSNSGKSPKTPIYDAFYCPPGLLYLLQFASDLKKNVII